MRALRESYTKRNKTNKTIIQKGRPLQKPAKPVLMLHAKPITNVAKRNIPKIIVNFSLIFILIFNHALILLVNQLAFLNNLSSSYKDETS